MNELTNAPDPVLVDPVEYVAEMLRAYAAIEGPKAPPPITREYANRIVTGMRVFLRREKS